MDAGKNSHHEPNPHFFDATSDHKSYKSPDAAFADALHTSRMNAPVATRVPKLRKGAWILIGLMLFSAVQSLLMSSVMVGVAGAGSSNGFMTPITILTWIAGIATGSVLLKTKDVALARKIVAGVCVLFAYWIIVALIGMDIIGAAIDGFLLWWTYDLYQSLDGLDFKP